MKKLDKKQIRELTPNEIVKINGGGNFIIELIKSLKLSKKDIYVLGNKPNIFT